MVSENLNYFTDYKINIKLEKKYIYEVKKKKKISNGPTMWRKWRIVVECQCSFFLSTKENLWRKNFGHIFIKIYPKSWWDWMVDVNLELKMFVFFFLLLHFFMMSWDGGGFPMAGILHFQFRQSQKYKKKKRKFSIRQSLLLWWKIIL